MYSYMRPTLGMVLLRLTIRCGDVFLTLNAWSNYFLELAMLYAHGQKHTINLSDFRLAFHLSLLFYTINVKLSGRDAEGYCQRNFKHNSCHHNYYGCDNRHLVPQQNYIYHFVNSFM
jgi:hypothetical protein